MHAHTHAHTHTHTHTHKHSLYMHLYINTNAHTVHKVTRETNTHMDPEGFQQLVDAIGRPVLEPSAMPFDRLHHANLDWHHSEAAAVYIHNNTINVIVSFMFTFTMFGLPKQAA